MQMPRGACICREDSIICVLRAGFYKPDVRNGLCLSCPDYPNTSTLNDGAVTEAECVCAVNYYDSNLHSRRASVDVQKFSVGVNSSYYSDTSGNRNTKPNCVECDATRANCSKAGLTVATIPVRAGYWRVNTLSTDIRECPQSGRSEICIGFNYSAYEAVADLPNRSVIVRTGTVKGGKSVKGGELLF